MSEKSFYVMTAVLLLLVSGCGVGWQKSLTKEELLQYPTVIALAKDRYTNIRASSGMSQWQQSEAPGRSIASFRIATNTTRVNPDQQTLLEDLAGYCEVKGGIFKDVRVDSRARKRVETSVSHYGYEGPPDFQCAINNDVLFMITMHSRVAPSKAVSVFIRINEASGVPMPIKSGRISMQ